MRLAVNILHYTGNEIQHVAVIACHRIRDVDDIHSGELFLGGSLGRINGRRRFNHIHYFTHFAGMRKGYIDTYALSGSNRRHNKKGSVEPWFLDPQLVAAARIIEVAATREVGFAD